MQFDIRSHQGVGAVEFGMTVIEVREALRSSYESFKRTPQSTHPCDFFEGLGCFVYYNENGRVEAVEFVEPASPMFGDLSLLSIGFQALKKKIEEVDAEVSIESDGFTSLGVGIGGWTPDGDDPQMPLESIIVFVSGYYD